MKPLKESFIKARDLDNLNKKKYILTNETLDLNGHTLYRIQALKDIPSIKVKKGDLGGWIESYDNLDQKGECWVGGKAKVFDNAQIYDDAWVFGNALVHGNAKVYGNALVHGNAKVYGNTLVFDNTKVYDNVHVYGNAQVYDDAEVCGWCTVYGNAKVYGNAVLCGGARINYNINSGTK